MSFTKFLDVVDEFIIRDDRYPNYVYALELFQSLRRSSCLSDGLAGLFVNVDTSEIV